MQTVAGPRIPGQTGVAAGANQHDFPRKTLAGAPMPIVDTSGQASAAEQISEVQPGALEVLQDDGLDLKAKLARIKEILTAQEKALAIFDEAEGPSPASTQGSAAEGANSGGGVEELAGMSPVVAARRRDGGPQPASRVADLVRDGHLPEGGRRPGAVFCPRRGEGPATETSTRPCKCSSTAWWPRSGRTGRWRWASGPARR